MSEPTFLRLELDLKSKAEEPAAQPPSERAYFTEGELLPWKGRWFRVHLNDERKVIELEMIKATDRSIALAERKERWMKRHPKATEPRRKK